MAVIDKFYQLVIAHDNAVIFIPLISSILIVIFIIIYQYIYPKKKIHALLLLILISIPPVLNIFRPGTYQSGDLSNHIEYLRAFYENISAGILIPRWAADFCAGNGCPTFLFSYVLPYYLASFFHLFNFSYLDSIKIVLAISFIGSGLAMYFFIRDEAGKLASVIAAIFYLFSPYHLIDLHFRVSVGEILSYVFIPLIFLFSRRLIIYRRLRYFFLTAITLVLLLLSHVATTVSIIPVLIIYDLLIIKKARKNIFNKQLFIIILSYFTSILLGMYYWLPSMLESKYSWFGLYGSASDFKPIQGYLFSTAGYGFLLEGVNGDYKLIIGYSHILMLIVAIFFLFYKKKYFSRHHKNLLIFLLSFFLIYFILMLRIAKPFWDYFLFLKFFLAVWRLLVPIGFITAVIAGIITSKIKNANIIIIICFMTIISTMLNWGNRGMVTYNSNEYYTHWDEYTEYTEVGNPFYNSLEKTKVKKIVQLGSLKYRAKYPIESLSGNIQYKEIKKTPQEHDYVINVNNNAIIKENTFYFPGWEVIANNKKLLIDYKYSSDIGKITFKLPKGLYLIEIKFVDTTLRSIADYISFFTLSILLSITIYLELFIKNRKKLKKIL